MLLRKILLCSFLFFVFIDKGYSSDEQINGAWEFYKVSSVDVFGEQDSDTVRDVNISYEQVEIKADDSFLTIKNSLLSEKEICLVKYRKIKKTPLLYFHSDTTVAMYKKLFSHEGVALANYIYILMANEQSETCPSTYSEIIKSDDYLVLIDHYYAVFFRRINTNSPVKENFGDKFLDYCKDVKKNKRFDGGGKYICEFVNENINETYAKIREISTAGKLMKETLSKDNLKYAINDGVVSYQWESPEVLKVTISHGSETVIYEFQGKQSGTHLVITVDTGY